MDVVSTISICFVVDKYKTLRPLLSRGRSIFFSNFVQKAQNPYIQNIVIYNKLTQIHYQTTQENKFNY